MTWKVWHYNINKREIEPYDIFSHGGFAEDLDKLFKEESCLDNFDEKLKRILQYWFWAKCEHEVLICGWPPSHSDVDKKIDIYSQVMLNWDVFVEYVKWYYIAEKLTHVDEF